MSVLKGDAAETTAIYQVVTVSPHMVAAIIGHNRSWSLQGLLEINQQPQNVFSFCIGRLRPLSLSPESFLLLFSVTAGTKCLLGWRSVEAIILHFCREWSRSWHQLPRKQGGWIANNYESSLSYTDTHRALTAESATRRTTVYRDK